MKAPHFRIIELAKHQVLIQKDFDNDDNDESDLMVITFYLDGIKVKNSYGYDNSETRDKVFNEVTEKQLQSLIDNAVKMMLP